MNFHLQELIDLPRLQSLLDSLYLSSGIPSAIIDLEGTVLAGGGWQDICTKFHRTHPDALKDCVQSDTTIAGGVTTSTAHAQVTCPRGLTDTATPLIIEGQHLANVFTGQLFLEEPDRAFFQQQARQFGFDESAYLEALGKVPVITQKQLDEYLNFIAQFTEQLASQGLAHLRTRNSREDLREALKINTQIIQGVREGVIVYGLDLRYQVWNPFMEQLSGRPAEEVLGKHPLEVFPFLETVGIMARLHRALAGEQVEDLEFPYHVETTGRKGWNIDRCSAFRNADGEIIGVLGTVTDITERKLAEETLRASDAIYRELLDHQGEGFSVVDDQERFLLVNPVAEEIFGVPPGGLQGRSILEFLPPDQQDLVRRESRLRAQGVHSTYEVLIRRADGAIRTLLITATPRSGLEGGAFQAIGIFRDITERKQAEDQLRLSEENLAITFQSIGDAVIATDEAGLITRMNPTAERLTGWPVAGALGRPLTEVFRIVDAQTRAPSIDPVQAVLAHGEVVALANHTVLLARDGREYQIADSAAPIHDAAGRIRGVVLVFSDVTERYQLEETLSRTTDLLRSATEIARIGGWELELPSMELTWSLGTYRLHDLDPETPVDLEGGIRFFAPEAQPVIAAALKAAIEAGTPYDLELPLVSATGRAFWARAQCSPVTEGGKVVKLLGALQDITERKRDEEALRQRTGELSTLLEVSKNLSETLDLEVILQTATDRVAELTDLKTAAVYLLSGEQLRLWATSPPLPPQFPEDLRLAPLADHPHIREAITGRKPVFVPDVLKVELTAAERAITEMRGLRSILYLPLMVGVEVLGVLIVSSVQELREFSDADLGLCQTLANVAAIATANGKLYEASQAYGAELEREIAEHKLAEAEKSRLQAQLQQSQKMESLGTLAGGVAHDMNNVLGAILGLASAHIGSQPPGSPLHQALETICKATERGGKMVKSLLSFARQTPAESKQLDMNAILKEQVALLERTTLAKVNLEIDLEAGLRPILGDASALAHAFMNLCINSVDAMPENGTLTLHTRNVDNEWIEVVVEDDGAGMPKEVLDKAMDPFFTTKGTGKGTGLGLSMVFSTIKAHRGQMAIQSEPGQGTRVMLRFPALGQEAPVPRVVHPGAGAAPNPRGSLRVLLVDDDDLVQASIQMTLEMLGHTAVTTAQSGEDALASLEAGLEPDLVILDMNMPGLGGIGTLPRLRLLCPAVPVLLVTGRIDQTALNLASSQPGVTLLSKPFGLRELQRHLESIGLGGGERVPPAHAGG